MTKFKDSTVLITGGASGIGLLMGKILVSKGAKILIILDINATALARVKEDLASADCDILTIHADITKEQDLENALSRISSEGYKVDILINNAGVVTGKRFQEHTPADIDRNMGVNSVAPMKLTLALLPQMLERGTGNIVNISSAASMLSNSKMGVYCASKWAMTGWSDSLRIEMEQENTGIKVLTVTPYYIDTGMFRGVKSPIIPVLKPEKVARKIIQAIEKNKIILRTPWIIYTLPFIKGILPQRLLDIVIGKFFGIYQSMDNFKGRRHE
ncbi:SDR family oxidoreductase [Christiangramia sabulilitoris]|uniref:SDR family oxidoreductase n=1 Tax=Christiangramia sabulilitoris TaxID=2583991 RepID=A0A550I728_9FLAO|nr:SDR family oxidoreductase [Christiangramia sabulilitoris]TRO66761.1 SDR family oxidoreductase [Christiangramia sabulilitoris]